MYYQPRGFVEHNDVLILKHNIERTILSRPTDLGLKLGRQGKYGADGDLVSRPNLLAID